MTVTAAGSGGMPSPSIPAERTGPVPPSQSSRRASSGVAIGERHTLAVHSTRTPACGPESRCGRAAGTAPPEFITILPENTFPPIAQGFISLALGGHRVNISRYRILLAPEYLA